MEDSQKAAAIARFSDVTGSSTHVARATLESCGWDVDYAITQHYEGDDDDSHQDDDEEPDIPAVRSPNTNETKGPAVSRTARPARERGPVTLKDLQSGGSSSKNASTDKPQDMFAGGEKSGLAVQNPDRRGDEPTNHFENIMRQARADRARPDADSEEEGEPSGPSHFQGRAQTLGGDDTESRVIEDPRATSHPSQRPARVTRSLHLWNDGFSIDDGQLYRFDDPANARILAQINQGTAPLHLLDVQPGQEVDLNLVPHKGENYVAPKKAFKPFSGQGQRLGAPTPSASTATTATPDVPIANTQRPQNTNAATASISLDDNLPIVVLQIRLGDGSRLQGRFNTIHTIGDVYDFVDSSSATSTRRPYSLMTTFPARELTNKAQVLGDMNDFRRGGTVVQKWT